MNISVSYIPEHCLTPSCPKVFINESPEEKFRVEFWDNKNKKLLLIKEIKGGETAKGTRQWYTEWRIVVKHKGKIVFTDNFFIKPELTTGVYINIDSKALGDSLAWMPYAEEFRKKHSCSVIFSSFWNRLYQKEYPNLYFVHPTEVFDKVYANYNVGAVRPFNKAYSPNPYGKEPLQKIAADILGLDFKEIKPKITIPQVAYEASNIVCISEYASGKIKQWPGSWQKIVDFLNSHGYIVKVISLERTKLKNVIDRTGTIDIEERITDLKGAKFFIGGPSGLSWLSWAVDTHVFLISDYSPPTVEFQSNCTRIYSHTCSKMIDENFKWSITEQQVIKSIETYITSNTLVVT